MYGLRYMALNRTLHIMLVWQLIGELRLGVLVILPWVMIHVPHLSCEHWQENHPRSIEAKNVEATLGEEGWAKTWQRSSMDCQLVNGDAR